MSEPVPTAGRTALIRHRRPGFAAQAVRAARTGGRDRSLAIARHGTGSSGSCARRSPLVVLRWRATGRHHVPESGGVLLVCESPELPRCLLPGDPAAAAAQLRRSLDAVRPGAGHVHSLGRRVSDPARGDGGVGHEGDAQAAPRRGHRHAVPRRDAQPRRRAGAAQAGHRGPGRPRGRPRGAGRPGRDTRGLAEIAGCSASPHPVRVHYGRPIFPRSSPAWRPRPSRR